MVLQALTSFVYSVVQSSWIVAAISLKYILAVQVFYAQKEEGAFVDNLKVEISEHSREAVTFTVFIGLCLTVVGLELSALLPVVSYSIAVAYFGYLFWEF